MMIDLTLNELEILEYCIEMEFNRINSSATNSLLQSEKDDLNLALQKIREGIKKEKGW